MHADAFFLEVASQSSSAVAAAIAIVCPGMGQGSLGESEVSKLALDSLHWKS